MVEVDGIEMDWCIGIENCPWPPKAPKEKLALLYAMTASSRLWSKIRDLDGVCEY